MILTEFVEYRGKTIKVDELKKNSSIKIEVRCPQCNNIRVTTLKSTNKNGHYYCHKCVLRNKNIIVMKCGEKYGKWTIISNGSKVGRSLCKCECGTVREVDSYALRNGLSKSCGCVMAEINKANRKYLEIGSKYHRLTVVDHAKRSGYSTCICECENTCEVSNSRLLTGGTKSCGCLQKEKAGEAMSKSIKQLKGEKHPNWKGGITSENRRIRSSERYKNWRTSVFERDGHTCQKCGQVGYQLNAHHIVPFAEDKRLRTDINNGITFCVECHREFHSTHGRKNVSQDVVDSFISQQSKK